jgi:PASTA domain/S-layer homology domain
MYNTANESSEDVDLGSGGIMLLPDAVDSTQTVRHLAVGAGKDSNLYLVDRDNMGKYDPTSDGTIYQQLTGALPGGIWGNPAYFNGFVYFGAIGDHIRAFQLNSARLSAASMTLNTFGYPGTTPSISANGNSNAILWAVENSNPAVLHAYDATDLTTEFYNSNQAPSGRDQFGPGNKFIVPTIADGKVFVGTTNSVAVFGLLSLYVPNVVGLDPATATTSINSAGLAVGPITYLFSNTVPAGLVLSENPAVGTLVNPGSSVSLVLSTGPLNPSAEFNDVPPNAAYFAATNLMFQDGVSTGCAQGSTPQTRSFCPGSTVTRQEMAAFIVRAVTGTTTPAIYNPVPDFTDVPASNPFFPHIQKLVSLGITNGCGPGLFCPNGTIPRWAMAMLLVRARLTLYGAAFTSSATPYFADVPTNVEGNGIPFPFIQRSYEEAITNGCGTNPLTYCPDELVTRWQMALFIMRALFNETMILPPGAPLLTGASPNVVAAAPGSQITVTITGVNTNFQTGDTVTVPSGMLDVSNVVVNTTTSITATLTTNATTVAGPQSLVVTTGGQNLTLPLAIKVGVY